MRTIQVLHEVRFFSLVRNEVVNRARYRLARQRLEMGSTSFAEDERTQRHTVALRDVAYLLTADVQVRAGVREDPAKYREQFRRRVQRGQCYHRPYLGCREFAANFSAPTGTEQPIQSAMANRALGWMLFDLRYTANGSGRGVSIFFEAALQQGILQVPPALYEDSDAVTTFA